MGKLEVVAWVRFCSDGGIEGPIMDNDKRMDDVRRKSGAWSPLVRQSDALAVIAEKDQLLDAERARFAGRTRQLEAIDEAHRNRGAMLVERDKRIAELEAENARLRDTNEALQDKLDFIRTVMEQSLAANIKTATIGVDMGGESRSIDWPADDKRMDQIGREGNEGLIYK